MIKDIPSCPFLQVRDYFVIHCSKWLYFEIKRNYDIHIFPVKLSVAYLTRQNPVCDLINRMTYDKVENIVSHLINNPPLQIVFSFSKEELLWEEQKELTGMWSAIYTNIHLLSNVYGIIQLSMCYTDYVGEYTVLNGSRCLLFPSHNLTESNQHIISVYFTNPFAFDDISRLPKLSSLRITYDSIDTGHPNPYVSKMPLLPNLRKLENIGCFWLNDVTDYQGIHDLEIRGNDILVDVKPLAMFID
jgi:hypothetical protein